MRRRFGAATLVAELALESIELAIEMESESPSTICAGLKLPVPLGYGLHPAMAKFEPCSMQDFTGERSRYPPRIQIEIRIEVANPSYSLGYN